MHTLYMVFIYPLEFLMQSILEFSYAITDNYGWAIIILSIVVNIILLPLYYMAERWKFKDQIIQSKMKIEISNIKRHYKGQERHFYIQTIYRRYAYHPLSSVKASVGFLIQIPFFFAAFHLLSNFEPLNGVVFGILKDLGAADHLLYDINILPIIMTLVNLLSAYIYIEFLSKSEKVQLFALAFIFLIVLYSESSGLLLYWTMNNIFSLFKNIIEKKLNLGTSLRTKMGSIFVKKSWMNIERFNQAYHMLIVPQWFIIFLFILTLDRIFHFNLDKGNLLFGYESIVLFLYINILFFLHYASNTVHINRSFFSFILLLFVAVLILIIDTVFGIFNLFSLKYLQENTIIILLTIFLFLTIRIGVSKAIFLEKTYTSYRLFIVTFISLFLLFLLVNPILLYGDGEDFLLTYKDFIPKSLLGLLMGLGIVSFIYSISSKNLRVLFTLLGVYILSLSILYSFVLVKDYGLMDHFVFIDTSSTLFVTTSQKYLEVVLLLVFFVLLAFVLRYYKAIIEKILIMVLLMLLSFSIINSGFNEKDNKEVGNTEELRAFQNELNTTLAFSKDKNVLIFLLDAYSGGDLEKVLKERKDIFKNYEGFVRYRNVATIGTNTWSSIHSMFGGRQFTNGAMNSRDSVSLQEKIKKAYHILSNAFIPKEWDLTFFHPAYSVDIDKKVNIPKFNYGNYYLGNKKKINDSEIKNFEAIMLLKLSLFKIVPFFRKDSVYNNGNWGLKNAAKRKKLKGISSKISHWALLNILEESLTTNSRHKTLKYLHLQMPHYPNIIDKNGETEGPSSVYIESYKSLEKIGEILLSLKKKKVYDQTKIIIVSDHGTVNRENTNFPKSFNLAPNTRYGYRMQNGYINPILLIKDFDTSGAIKTSDRLMSNSDVPVVICSVLENGCDIDDIDPIKNDLNRTLDVFTSKYNGMSANEIEIIMHYQVKENIFDIKNWKRIK